MSSLNSSNPIPECQYQIFLNFRGKDTRLNFADHLFKALSEAGFKIYKDNLELQKGEIISDQLLKAIEESLLSVVILSKNYASSTWCLTELVKILECRKLFGRKVLPIFYGVDPSVVRYQTKRFEEAFKRHEERCEDKEKIQRWRDALEEVASLSGIDSKNRRETKLIEEIVADVWIKLQPEMPSYSEELVGIDSRVKHVYSLLRMGFHGVHFVGICGMGGLGKTTLTNVVFQNIRKEFDIDCFLGNITKMLGEKGDGLIQLQRQLLFPLKIKSLDIKTPKEGKDIIRNQLREKRVLLVLDDVSAKSQLENLAGSKEWFGPGSRIIVTTRDLHLLKSHEISATYEVDILNMDESLQLFHKKVFKGEQPSKHLLELSNYVVEQAAGLPLAVVVLGSFLCDRDMIDWKDAVDLLKQDSHGDIQKILRISYDKLGPMEKDVFLDIACFFVGESRNSVIRILESCGFLAKICIDVLIEKSLVTCEDGLYLRMHDLLQEMGRNIASKERSNETAKWSRLWSLKDINQILKNDMVNESIEAIVLKLPSRSHEAPWDPKVFSNMPNLRLLIVSSDLSLSQGLKCLPRGLKVLIWKNYPLKDLPLEVKLDKLVWLEMPNSKIRQLWNETQVFSELVFLDLSDSKDLTKTPSFNGTLKLERLYLRGCESLVEVDPSFGQLQKLVEVDFNGCRNLTKLPIKLEMASLEKLSFNDCSNVKQLPEFGENMGALKHLILDGTAIAKLPQSLGSLTGLRSLSLKCCKDIIYLPTLGFSSLSELRLCGYILTYESIPEDIDSTVKDLDFLALLEYLKINGNAFVNLPCGRMSKLLKLRQLYSAKDESLNSLPRLPTYVQHVGQKCGWMEPSSFRLQKLILKAAVKFKEAEPRPHSKGPVEFQCLYPITGGEIPAWLMASKQKFPAWFYNLNHFVQDGTILKGLVPNYLLSKSSAVSIIENIPEFCHGNKCWEIFECLVFDDLVPSHSEDLELYCHSEAIGEGKRFQLGNVSINCIRAYRCPYILIICCRINGWLCNQKKLKLTFYTRPSVGIVKRRRHRTTYLLNWGK